ncbi:hypothetical protein D5086_024381 [Populus alba]|uniref:Uncharacterized protein n=3 Tax=Populus TaxID=3689 RepID=A0A4U5P3T6_POPAL|nr:uncharacterized protein LOC118036530 [Populus alba]KAJ6974855.1 hypothetical protein NC653_030864 [Populus alba x Populus x berolinensis]TKR90856.1 uncharacterized protein D5086_0000229420 [Populus alba]
MKPNLLTADSFLIFNSLSSLTRNSIPFPRNSIPHPKHFLSVIFPHPNSSRPSRLIPICSSSNPTRKQSTSTNEQVSLNSNVEVLGADELERNLNVQVGNPVAPNYIHSWTKLSLSDRAFFLLSFIACTTSIAFTSLVVAAVPTLYAMGKAATSLSKLADTAREELPSTMAAIRLSGMEISDLTLELSDLSQEITDGVNKSAQAVQAAEAGIRQIGALAHQHTMSMIQERASLPIISLQPVVAGAAKQTSRAVGQATKTIMNMISRGEFNSENEDASAIDRVEI